jgi:hypothetical protein
VEGLNSGGAVRDARHDGGRGYRASVARLPTEPETRLSPAEKLRIAIELHEVGRDLMRQNLRRRHPDADAASIEAMLVAWLQTRPGAEHGDCDGRPGTWPRSGRGQPG